jgi:hypothetical protein
MMSSKIQRDQKLFLKAMKEKFAEDPAATSIVFPPASGWAPEPVVEDCPMCAGRGYRKGAFCHTCGGTGLRKVRS